MKFYKIYSLLIFQLLLLSNNLFAAEGSADETLDAVAKVMLGVTLVVILLVIWLIVVYSEKNDTEGEIFFTPLYKILNLLTGSKPVDEEQELLMAHEYDGIKELDNKIPPWFHGLFWLTIIFSIVYMIQYHLIGSGDIQREEYIAEMEAAAYERQLLVLSGALINEETVVYTTDAAALSLGKDVYDKNCATCHGFGGEGLVGPNFADDYWIHGGGIKNIFKIIKYGVPAKGMISWEGQLDPTQMQNVGSYIMTLRGTNPPNQKGPEGEKWDPASDESVGFNAVLSDKGIGPVKDITLAEIDDAWVKQGEDLFILKCSSCHKVDKRFVGPPLHGVIDRRSPEWIMNMILNPEEMVNKNTVAKELFLEYLSPMANQSLSQDEARTILEYLRTLSDKEL
jgi:cytochrome c oxidase cbb3-type subunit 3